MSAPNKVAPAPEEQHGAAEKESFPKNTAEQLFTIVDLGNSQLKLQPRIRVRGKEYHVCYRSLFIFPLTGTIRQQVIAFVEWKWFDRFILFLIMVNSILLAAYQYRASENEGFNWFVDKVLDPVFTGFFTIEFILKVIAWGFFLDSRSYLREFWNWLDFIVVVTALLSFIPGMDSGLGFLRLFRILRPLRSLNALPQMKLLVNTVISSVPRLANVTIMMFFCFWIFGIIGITLLDGIFYHGCRATQNPVLRVTNTSTCWEWPFTGDERLCGGRYSCDSPPDGVAVGFCGGREDDPNKSVRPNFPGGRRGYPWCEGSQPKKIFPETDFVHFDHMGGALLTVFQCMTMEGWTDIMYYVQDGYGFWVATVYFFTLIPITSFFLLNVALAVVDEAREDIDGGKDEEGEEEDGDKDKAVEDAGGDAEKGAGGGIEAAELAAALVEKKYWLNIAPVRVLHAIAYNEIFVNFIMLFIAANVITMMLEQFPPQVAWQDFLDICEKTFLGIFSVEMVIMLGALGPKDYVTNPVTCFDGVIVIGSLVQAFATSGGSALTALRTLRLSRVLNKLANRWPSFRVLLKAMVQTAYSLNYWLVLFFLMLYIITLMCMSFFQKTMHFSDLDGFSAVSADQGQPWCAGSEHETDVAFKQDCIPRAHFDTFLWALVTVFQIMTGENWNWIMYSAMRAQHWWVAILFVCIIVFGQILFLSLFLSMLMSKFDSVQDSLEKTEMSRRGSLSSNQGGMKVSQTIKAALVKSLTRRLSQVGIGEKTDPVDTVKADGTGSESVQVVDNKGSEAEPAAAAKESGADFSPVVPLPGQTLGTPSHQANSWMAVQVEPQPNTGDGAADTPQDDPSLVLAALPRRNSETRIAVEKNDDGVIVAADAEETGPSPQPQSEQESHKEDDARADGAPGPSASEPPEPSQLPCAPGQPRPPTAKDAMRGPPPEDGAFPLELPKEEEISDLLDGPLDEEHTPDAQQKDDIPAAVPAPLCTEPQKLMSFDADHPDMVSSLQLAPEVPEDKPIQKWPHGYAFFVLSEANPIRRACRWLLDFKIRGLPVFDNFILLCILVSSLGMALDFPLRDPSDLITQIIRRADFVFAMIFTAEMVVKLMALGLVWGDGAYLQSGWNWLDGIVVAVSLVGIFTSGSGGFLKTLRILRAFRPLRVISRNQNLKVVVQTIFASLPALMTLIIVCWVFLLIFALFALSYLNGTFYHCQEGAVTPRLTRHLGSQTGLHLCLDPNVTHANSACPRGQWSDTSRSWQDTGSCSAGNIHCSHGTPSGFTLSYQRVTADTPICVGRCSLDADSSTAPSWLCPRRYENAEELPSNCGSGATRSVTAQLLEKEAVGQAYIDSMTRKFVMPCGGSAAGPSAVDFPASAVSCRAAFCPNGASSEKRESCESNCRKHPHFCKDTCSNGGENSLACASCRQECQAACECEEHCEPLMQDAALCVEQGGSWMPSLPQNFNNIWNSLLTLFEISSTEAWVDVMYAACDSTGAYMQPVRDNQQWLFAPFFMVYIFMSFMFLLNLSVGVIVDNFMDLKAEFANVGRSVLLTPAQQKWMESRHRLFKRPVLFTLTNLHQLGRYRRSVYKLVSSEGFEACMTSIIVMNTMVMACKLYPAPTPWWEDMREGMDYVFTAIFTVEFGLKFYALRRNYWKISWNCFDFVCVATAIIGIILTFLAPVVPALEVPATMTQLLRIFRIARLFRLLKSKRLNTIFTALVVSLPKLGNVLMVLLLLLVLYSILGVSLFSSVKHSEYLNHHGNFAHMGWAFITLFRAVTGEAWNSIMHDLLKGEKDFFEEGSWCAPDTLYDASTPEKFKVLNDKCLIDNPNSCVQTVGGWNFLPAAFWTTYILIICLMVMNLVIAVILEGYNDGKGSPEDEVIEVCIQTWRKYDADQKMTLPLKEAMHFIYEVITTWLKQQGKEDGEGSAKELITLMSDLSKIPMKNAKACHMTMTADGRVDFLEATKQVLRFTCIDNDVSHLHEIEEECLIHVIDKKEEQRLHRLEAKRSKDLKVKRGMTSDLRLAVAAVKLQRYYRTHVAPKRKNWMIESMG